MVVLFFGDVVGAAACECMRRELPGIRRRFGADVVVINGENSAEGNGITPHSAKQLFDCGANVITTGNHGLRRREVYELLDSGMGLIRPANYHRDAPGNGVYLYDHPACQLCVINLQGRVYMDSIASPFDTADALLKKICCPNILVDFHAEATAEKLALAYYLDGRVSAVIGTHTHVQTADERILPQGTAYLTDAGMCGGRDSILGVQQAKAIYKLRTGLPTRFQNETHSILLNGAAITLDAASGKATKIERFTFGPFEPDK